MSNVLPSGLNPDAAFTSSQGDGRVKHRTVRLDGLDIFYRETGSRENPTVLLLHGYPTSSHMFRDLMSRLNDRYHLVAPDYPGFGYSSAPPVEEFDYTFDNLAKVVEKFTQALERAADARGVPEGGRAPRRPVQPSNIKTMTDSET